MKETNTESINDSSFMSTGFWTNKYIRQKSFADTDTIDAVPSLETLALCSITRIFYPYVFSQVFLIFPIGFSGFL